VVPRRLKATAARGGSGSARAARAPGPRRREARFYWFSCTRRVAKRRCRYCHSGSPCRRTGRASGRGSDGGAGEGQGRLGRPRPALQHDGSRMSSTGWRSSRSSAQPRGVAGALDRWLAEYKERRPNAANAPPQTTKPGVIRYHPSQLSRSHCGADASPLRGVAVQVTLDCDRNLGWAVDRASAFDMMNAIAGTPEVLDHGRRVAELP
jgi:hypothetical protein